MSKKLYLVRGLPGSGKSTLGDILKGENGSKFEADTFFMVKKENGEVIDRHVENGVYDYDKDLIGNAHSDCLSRTENSMSNDVENVVVTNTFTQEWEMEKYYELAIKYDYQVFSIIVENRHGGIDKHNVPNKSLKNMERRFDIKLRKNRGRIIQKDKKESKFKILLNNIKDIFS